MKTIIILVLLSFSGSLAFTQEVKKVSKTLSPLTREEYEVLKSDKKTKHGLYRKITGSKQLLEEGYYKFGQRDSVWKRLQKGALHKIGSYKQDQPHGLWLTYTNIFDPKPGLRDSGAYNMGNKIGLWKYWDRKGNIDLVYDYDKGIALEQKQDSTTYLIISGKDTLYTNLDHPPVYKDGWDQFYFTFTHNLKFNTDLFKKTAGLKATIYIAILVNEQGVLEELKAISNTPEELNQMAMRALSANDPNNWLPGIYLGKPVKTQLIIPVDFTNRGILNP